MAVKGLLTRLALAAVPPLYLGLTRLLFATLRKETPGAEHYERLLAGGQPFIACLWHYSIFYGIHRIKGRGWVIMVSPSNDAEYVSRVLSRMGHLPVRGSRTKGGLVALKEMVVQIRGEGRRAAIVGDGSQGPALQLQPGVVLLASRTGAPILPLAWGADRCWRFRSWDRTALPKPFSRVTFCFDEPFIVPQGLKADDLEPYRQELERRMVDLHDRAWASGDRSQETGGKGGRTGVAE